MSDEHARITPSELLAGRQLLTRAFLEDLGPFPGLDLTEAALGDTAFDGTIVARQDGVVCGLAIAAAAFEMRGVGEIAQGVEDGFVVSAGTKLLRVRGRAADIFAAERTALNVLQRLSGTATLTRTFVDAIEGSKAVIVDTRKTTPGMRALQRWAVRCGGGSNHRFGLFDEAMLKDNHIAAAGDIATAVAAIRAHAGDGTRIHVEADTLEQVEAATDAGADVVLLDNMAPDDLRAAVALVAGRAVTEASGGITLDTVAAIAATGVDRISIGALTHSAPAFDASLDAGRSQP
ncbi:MAG: nadC [Thermoleophilia bacterium]|nr:nadC [Thermoleophilia bacterium]